MLKDQIIEGFRVSINQLIPGTEVTVFSEIPNEIKTAGLYKDDSSFARIDDFTIFLWFNDVLKSKIYLKIQRNIIQISHYEEMILKSIPELMNNFQDIHSEEFFEVSLKAFFQNIF